MLRRPSTFIKSRRRWRRTTTWRSAWKRQCHDSHCNRPLQALPPCYADVPFLQQISAVVGDEQLAAENMNLLRAVGQASRFDSRVVALSYKGGPVDEPPIVLVGKVIPVAEPNCCSPRLLHLCVAPLTVHVHMYFIRVSPLTREASI